MHSVIEPKHFVYSINRLIGVYHTINPVSPRFQSVQKGAFEVIVLPNLTFLDFAFAKNQCVYMHVAFEIFY